MTYLMGFDRKTCAVNANNIVYNSLEACCNHLTKSKYMHAVYILQLPNFPRVMAKYCFHPMRYIHHGLFVFETLTSFCNLFQSAMRSFGFGKVISARIPEEWGRLCFHRCLSVHRGRYPWSVVYGLWSLLLSGGTPCWGYPSQDRTGYPYPLPQARTGGNPIPTEEQVFVTQRAVCLLRFPVEGLSCSVHFGMCNGQLIQ